MLPLRIPAIFTLDPLRALAVVIRGEQPATGCDMDDLIYTAFSTGLFIAACFYARACARI